MGAGSWWMLVSGRRGGPGARRTALSRCAVCCAGTMCLRMRQFRHSLVESKLHANRNLHPRGRRPVGEYHPESEPNALRTMSLNRRAPRTITENRLEGLLTFL